MILDTVVLVVALFVILGSSELFTNGVEWLGQRLKLSEGVVGSVLAAVGTALPETLIPFVAVLFFPAHHGHEVGIGAIMGAPFMLSTLTFAVCGFAMWRAAKLGRRAAALNINRVVLSRDLFFFVVAYTGALLAALLSDYREARWVVALVLLLIYPVYLFQTFQHSGEVGECPEQLHLDRIFGVGSERLKLIIPQIVLGLLGILGGAVLFVDRVEDLADALNVPAVILSLIVAPIATELPEKINSVLWARSGKDTLAMGNITGALVFQSCFPVAFGVAFTHWKLSAGTALTAVVAIISALVYLGLIRSGRLASQHLMMGGLAYAATIALMLLSGNSSH